MSRTAVIYWPPLDSCVHDKLRPEIASDKLWRLHDWLSVKNSPDILLSSSKRNGKSGFRERKRNWKVWRLYTVCLRLPLRDVWKRAATATVLVHMTTYTVFASLILRNLHTLHHLVHNGFFDHAKWAAIGYDLAQDAVIWNYRWKLLLNKRTDGKGWVKWKASHLVGPSRDIYHGHNSTDLSLYLKTIWPRRLRWFRYIEFKMMETPH